MILGRKAVVVAILSCTLAAAVPAFAEESDNFTCRSKLTKDALAKIDTWINARIQDALTDANRKAGGSGCDENCIFSELRGTVGASYPNPLTMIPHSRLSGWIDDQKDIERCHLKFGDTIYGAKNYNQVWMYPFHGRIIFVADSLRLAGRTIGVDKFDHFIREGLDHWKFLHETSSDIAASIARETGPANKKYQWTENGLKGMSLTGVFAYADLAAGYFGYRFWDEALSLGRPGSFVFVDPASHQYRQVRTFTFADYVNDAWDESLNPSTFDDKLAKDVEAALKARSMVSPAGTCQSLAKLPQASLYVNPVCLGASKVPAALDSKTAWPTNSNSDSTPLATSPSIATAVRAHRPRSFATS